MFSKIPFALKRILDNNSVGAISTISVYNIPIIDFVPFIPLSESSLLFIIKNTSKIIKNLSNNSYYTFTIDEIHLEDPTKNSGLMFEGRLTALPFNQDLIDKININEKLKEMVQLFEGKVTKIVMWRGPYFKTIRTKK
ncbi:MAG: hypothetical protein EAX86_06205 [Candidatus Heimdallarchaeota archaeon]|nr:hypothetical protein [Candidatus Heimdallarchaeota archaeon]